MNNLKTYLPHLYKGVFEFDELMSTENELFEEVGSLTEKGEKNQFILTADIDGIKQYERMLGIIPNPGTESLEFRRTRIINRLSMTPPFTLRFLRNKLDEIIGVGRWSTNIDFENYTLYIESSAENQIWYHEILVTLTKLKPANMVFINKPLITSEVKLSEEINLTEVVFNYRLGTSWVLGAKAFTSLDDMGVIKMGNIPSVQAQLLNNIADFTASDIDKVRINEEIVLTDFVVKESTNNMVTVEYEISSGNGIVEVTLIELLDVNSNVLTSSAVYVPILESVLLKHTIKIKEGV